MTQDKKPDAQERRIALGDTDKELDLDLAVQTLQISASEQRQNLARILQMQESEEHPTPTVQDVSLQDLIEQSRMHTPLPPSRIDTLPQGSEPEEETGQEPALFDGASTLMDRPVPKGLVPPEGIVLPEGEPEEEEDHLTMVERELKLDDLLEVVDNKLHKDERLAQAEQTRAALRTHQEIKIRRPIGPPTPPEELDEHTPPSLPIGPAYPTPAPGKSILSDAPGEDAHTLGREHRTDPMAAEASEDAHKVPSGAVVSFPRPGSDPEDEHDGTVVEVPSSSEASDEEESATVVELSQENSQSTEKPTPFAQSGDRTVPRLGDVQKPSDGERTMRGPGLSEPRPFSVTEQDTEREPGSEVDQESLFRRYSDGVVLDAHGKPASPDASARVRSLPYASTQVIGGIKDIELLKELGQGTYGTVYKAYALRHNRWCACKLMKPTDALSAVAIQRFQNELVLCERTSCEGFAPLLEVGEENGTFFVATALFSGRSFLSLLQEDEADTLEAGLRVLSRAARSLAALHREGLLHRGLKPTNILVERGEQPIITDVGAACEGLVALGLEEASWPLETPAYLAPEQVAQELHRLGPGVDIYALGALLYHLIAGRAPVMCDSLEDFEHAVLAAPLEHPGRISQRQRGRKPPRALVRICLTALARRAAWRYASADAMADDIDAFLADAPVQARPPGLVTRLRDALQRPFWAVLSLVALVCSVSLASIMGFALLFGDEHTPTQQRQMARKLAQAVSQSVRTSMLAGRPDISRALIQRLHNQPNASVVLLRPDRSLAHSGNRTADYVKARLKRADIRAWLKKERALLLPAVRHLEETALPKLVLLQSQATARKAPPHLHLPPELWKQVLTQPREILQQLHTKDQRLLLLMKPLQNEDSCQSCHGATGAKKVPHDVGGNRLRGVVVVQIPLPAQHLRLLQTLGWGVASALILLLLLGLFVRAFRLRLHRPPFGQAFSASPSEF